MDPSHPTDGTSDAEARRLAEFAARTRSEGGRDVAPCPDPDLLAGFAEGRLVVRERDAMEAHLARCDDCRVVVAELVGDRNDPALSRPVPVVTAPILRPWRFGVAAAAAILVAAFVFHAATRGGSELSTQEALVASARDLASARPDLFGGFEPLRPGETLAPSLAQKRGALSLIAPVGKVLDTKPEFRWESAPGVARWRVSLLTAKGKLLWSADTAESALAFPPQQPELLPGTRYIWEASGEGPLGPEGSRRAFDVASDDERRAFDEAVREIGVRAPEKLRPLLRAHVALRKGLYAASAVEAEAYVRAHPTDDVGRATLAAAERALGVPDAESEDR